MDAVLLPGCVTRESEFSGGLTGACGPNAAAMAERWADQSGLETLDVYHRMRAAGRCDANGEATLAALAADAADAGYRVAALDYREPLAEAAWRAFFGEHVGRAAIICEVANGQALRDALSGDDENAQELRYHFILVAGWHPGGVTQVAQTRGRTLPAGWWCADGANRVVGDVLEFYADATLAAAMPCGALAIWGRAAAVAAGGETTMAIPVGWHDDGTTLTAPNGVPVTQGFRAWVLAHPWQQDDWPLAPEAGLAQVEEGNAALGPGTRQDFRMTSLGWTQARGVYRIWAGQDLLALRARVAQAATRIAALEASLAAASGQAASVADTAALAAIGALRAALAAGA